MPSQVYKDYTKSMMQQGGDSAASMNSTADGTSAHGQSQAAGNTGQVDLMSHWQEPEYQEISSDEESDGGSGGKHTQDLLSSVMRSTFPKTPAMAGRKRDSRGEPISANSVKTPGSGLSAFVGIGDGAAMSATQMFHATQTPSSPNQDVAPGDAIFTRPSPNIHHSSPALHFSSPSRTLNGPLRAITEPRDVYMSLKESQEERKRRLLEMQRLAGRSSSGIARGADEDDDDEDSAAIRQARKKVHTRINSNALLAWDNIRAPERPGSRKSIASLEIPETPAAARAGLVETEKELVELGDDEEQSHDGESVDEYDEFAQDIRPSQCQATASSDGEEDGQPIAEGPKSPNSVAQNLDFQGTNELEGVTVADSQPHRQETQRPLPPVEPSSMTSVVPGSQLPTVSSQIRATASKNTGVAPGEAARQVYEQAGTIPDQERLPSSPPRISTVPEMDEQSPGESRPSSGDHVPENGPATLFTEESAHADEASPQLPIADANTSKELKSFRPTPHLQSSTIPETDPVEEGQSRTEDKPALSSSGGMVTRQRMTRESNNTSLFETAATHFSGSQSRLSQLSQARSSRQVSESPRKTAGIRRFADIATDPTPPDALNSIDMEFDILNTEDHTFLDAMSSPVSEPVTKRPKVSGRRSKRPADATLRVDETSVQRQVTPEQMASHNKGGEIEETAVEDGASPPKRKRNLNHGQAPVPHKAITIEQGHASHLVNGHAEALPEPEMLAGQGLEPAPQRKACSPERRNEAESNTPAKAVTATHRTNKPTIANGGVAKGRLVRPNKPKYGKRASRATSGIISPEKSRDEVAQTPQLLPDRPEPPTAAVRHLHLVPQLPAPEEVVTSSSESVPDLTKDVVCPKRVFALFKGTGQAYYPATCLGATTLDGQKLRIRFDDGTITQLEPMHVRRLELHRGDQVKVDLSGFRSKIYVVMGFSNKLDQANKEEFSRTDVYGYTTLQLTPKDRDSTLSQAAAGQAATLSIPSTHIYLTQTMWTRFDDRVYLGPASANGGTSSRVQTPVPDLSAPATPGSRSRRATFLSCPPLTHKENASPAVNRHGVFGGMAFAVSYSTDEKDRVKGAEKNRILGLIQEHGGVLLGSGFQELFDVKEVADNDNTALDTHKHRPSPALTDDSTDTTDGLSLTPQARSLGFVALIADKHSRRAKYVQALALSIPCLSGRWIMDSVSSGSALPWPKYLLPAGESIYLSGAVRSRTLAPFDVADAKLADIFRNREKLLKGGRVLLVGQGGKAKWEARKAYAFLTIALGAAAVRRVGSLDVAKKVIEQEQESWKWIYVDGRVDEAEKVLFGASKAASKKRKRAEGGPGEGKEKMVAGNGNVKIVGDEFVVQSLILGALIEE